VVITTQKKESALPVKRHLCHMFQSCIIKEASISFVHTHLFIEKQVSELQLEKRERERERERERGAFLERTFYICLSYLLALYWLSILRKFLLGLLPHEGFPG
jgi:hypothetical protein